MISIKHGLGVALLTLSIGCANKAEIVHHTQPVKWVLSEGLCEPETVIHDTVLDTLIVSNICGFKKNGEGYLSTLTRDGAMKTARWIDTLDAPAGMAILDRTLYVTDLDKVQVINLDRGEIVSTLGSFADAKAFNDLAVTPDGTIYVSDSARHKVIKIQDGIPTPFPNDTTEFKYANGMHLDENRLYIGGDRLWVIDLQSMHVEPIDVQGLSDIDGIETDGHGGLTASIVGGDVWHLPKEGVPAVWTARGVSSTNHAYLPDNDFVIIPTGYDNTVIAFQAPVR